MLPCEREGLRDPSVGLDLGPLQSLSSDLQRLSAGPSRRGPGPGAPVSSSCLSPGFAASDLACYDSTLCTHIGSRAPGLEDLPGLAVRLGGVWQRVNSPQCHDVHSGSRDV